MPIKKLLEKYIERHPKVQKLISYRKLQGMFPAGHYYSPIPSKEDINLAIRDVNREVHPISDIDLQDEHQENLLNDFSNYYQNLKFTEEKSKANRYFYNNDWFSYSDSIFLFSFIQHFKPSKIIEVGSGFSSAVMLDTRNQFNLEIEIDFIEPFPARLNTLLSIQDKASSRLFECPVQAMDVDVFSKLKAGDLLFIDSSHVLKAGSDLYHIMFNILPILKKGVFVHFHDIFYPFEYPDKWLRQGRFWNENYMLRAFLSHNKDWNIELFASYANLKFDKLIEEKFPLCAKNHGGSLYLRKAI